MTGPGNSTPATATLRAAEKINRMVDLAGNLLVSGFHYLALFAIGAATVWAALATFLGMVDQGKASIEDLLLLFIYLEIGAMVGIYFQTTRMPVRFLVYVAITALTRMMIGHVSVNHTPDLGILMIAGAILILALAVLVLRIGSYQYPSDKRVRDDATPPDSD